MAKTEAERAERKAKKLKAKADEEQATAVTATAGDDSKKDKKRRKEAGDADGSGSKKKKKQKQGADTHDEDGSDEEEAATVTNGGAAPLVPMLSFAQPMADDKQKHKLLKAVRRGNKHRTLKRGVKEITKAARKTPDSAPGSSTDGAPAVAIVAGDVWPEDVVSHIPVQCEEKNIPFIFVDSRKELGEAGATKRPTSCLLLMRDKPAGKKQDGSKSEDDEKESWDDTFKSVLKMVTKERAKYSW